MKVTCLLIQIGVCIASIVANWHWFGWQPVAITTTAGIVSMFFGALAKRLP